MPLALPPELRPLLSTPDALVPDAQARLDNPPWGAAAARILLVRLSPFADVDRSSSHLVLFAECRSALPTAFIDFAFFPGRADRALLSERGLSWYYGLASGRPPGDFDLVLVSLSFSLELLNLPQLLSTAGIPATARARAAERAEGGAVPLIALGGSAAACAGSLAVPGESLVDGLFFGEGEAAEGQAQGAIGEIAVALADARVPPEERLERAARIEGFWLPGRGSPRRRAARPAPRPLVSYPTLNSAESSTARLQISSGCPGLCSFCLEGWDRRPYRELPLQEVLDAARKLRAASGAETLEVYSFNFNTHSRILDLIFELNRVFRRVNFMSQRADALASSRPLLGAELAAGKRSFTLGVEGVSARMRAYYRKGLAGEALDAALDALVAPGIRELKLFFIVSGLEEEADLAEFAEFAESLGSRRRASAPGLRVLVSAGFLVRLPGTPLQFAPLCLDEARLSAIASSLRSYCERGGLEFRLAARYEEYCLDQVLSLGGPELGPWLASLPGAGAAYDGAPSRGAWDSLESFARGAGLLGPGFLGEKGPDWRPAIDLGDGPVLRAHYEEARAFRDRRPCLGAGCSGCGACPEPADAELISRDRALRPQPDYLERLSRLMSAKEAFAPVIARLELPPSLAGASPAYRSAWLLRELSAASPGVERSLFWAEDALFGRGSLAGMLPDSFVGETSYALYGPSREAILRALEASGMAAEASPPRPGRVEVEVELPPPWAAGAGAALRGWLASERVDFVERRSQGSRLLEVAARDARKRILLAAELVEGPRFLARLSLGPKARLPDWLTRLGPRAQASARVRVLGIAEDGAPG